MRSDNYCSTHVSELQIDNDFTAQPVYPGFCLKSLAKEKGVPQHSQIQINQT